MIGFNHFAICSKFNSVRVEKFINSVMWDGKKDTARKVVYDAMAKIKEDGADPLETFDTAIRNAICAGASLDYLAILDNVCWSSSGTPGGITLTPGAAAGGNGAISLKSVAGGDALVILDNGAASKIGLFGATPVVRQTVTGSRAGNAALASLLTEIGRASCRERVSSPV